MSTEWFCKIMGDEWGPVSTEELRAIARRGPLTRNDLVRRSESGTWVRGEIVQGLFEDSTSGPTGATCSPTRAITKSRGLPARRSVLQNCARKFWVQVGDHTAGPFTDSQLRQLAAQGKVKPHYLVSDNHIRWARASHVKGLTFGVPTSNAPQPAGH
jgi:hypothetical protein